MPKQAETEKPEAPLLVPVGSDSPPIRLFGPACAGEKASPNPKPPQTGGR